MLTKCDVEELAFDNLDNVADLRICEHLQIVRQLVGQACGAKGAGARSLNLPVNSKWKKRKYFHKYGADCPIYLPFAPAKIWPPITSAISGTPRSLTF